MPYKGITLQIMNLPLLQTKGNLNSVIKRISF